MSIEIPLVIKYRPKKLSDIIGQPVIVQAFTNAFKYNTLHHAYILAGPFGSGKTSLARIIAAMENCEKNPSKTPCGECKNCQDIFKGKSYDVKEINAASNRGIDDIRTIHREIYQVPIQCRTRYIIFDESHSLTGHAAEAALKMIEEPPEHVRFILATTEAHKLIDTIHSRCIMWKFNKIHWAEIYTCLQKIAKLENIEYEEDALKIAAKTAKEAQYVLGSVDVKIYFDLFFAILKKNVAACYKIIFEIFKDGKEAGIVIRDIHDHLDKLLTVKVCYEDLSILSLTDEELKRYSYQSSLLTGNFILTLLNLLNKLSFSINLVNLNPQNCFDQFVMESINAVDVKNKN